MRWRGRQTSTNVDDRRGKKTKRIGAGFGLGTIIIIAIALFMGQNPLQLLQQLQPQMEQSAPTSTGGSRADNELAEFVSVVLKDTETVWHKLFREQLGRTYEEPTLVLFDGSVQSRCGYASAATGPFYCPADKSLYIDLSFYRDLKDKFRAPGDFAMAYVVAHEVAHHVQNLLGISGEVSAQRRRVSETEYNQLSVKLELQADFLSGIWAHYADRMNNILEEGDIKEALDAAHAIGDDRIQMEARGYVVPDSFTHGTSEQRMRWFKRGFSTGDLSMGDTFAASTL